MCVCVRACVRACMCVYMCVCTQCFYNEARNPNNQFRSGLINFLERISNCLRDVLFIDSDFTATGKSLRLS